MRFVALKILFLFLFLSCTKDESVDSSKIDSSTDDSMSSSSTNSTDTELTVSFTPCENGMAGTYPCKGFNLLSRI